MIEWFTRNPVAANLLMVGILVAGLLSLQTRIPLEVFPSFELDVININTSLRGANPSSVEEGVTIRIEEAIHDLEGIKKLSSRSAENASIVTVEVEKGTDARELLNDIKLRVDAISTLPGEAERPVISIAERVRQVISIVIAGDLDEKELRRLGEFHRDQMLAIDGVSSIEFDSARDFEIGIEIKPETLDALDLTLRDVANAINQSSLDLSAGNIKNEDGEILVRTNAQAYTLAEYAKLPIVTTNNGNTVLLGDIATIDDGFEENQVSNLFNGQPSIVLNVFRTGDQSAIQVADKVKAYLQEATPNLPDGATMSYWRDRSKVVKGRLGTLVKSAWQGGLLVMLLLTLFLRPSVAFWVCLGIPVSFMGAFILMPLAGITLNVVSMFAFILVLGIVVDDAIVTGENIFRHMRQGSDSLTAAIEGTREVSVPVTFGVLTTVVAFTPLLMVEGARGAIFMQIPLIVIPVLLFSLIESKLILPAHLRHVQPMNGKNLNALSRLQRTIANGFERAILVVYKPILATCLRNKLITLVSAIVITVLTFSTVFFGWLKFIYFPRIESEIVSASLTMPPTTGYQITEKHIQRIVLEAQKLQEKYRDKDTGDSLIQQILASTGTSGRTTQPNVGRVSFQVQAPEERVIDKSVRSLVREWRQAIGEIPGAERLSFRAEFGRSGDPIDVQLRSNDLAELESVSDLIKQQLQNYTGLYDIQDNLSGGKDEFEITLKPQAYNLGVTLREIALQTRQAFFGLEAQRIQRGRDEVRVMLRFPREERSSLQDLYALPIQLANGETIALAELATITPGSSPSALYRVDRFRTVNITADADKQTTDLTSIKRDLTQFLDATLVNYPGMRYQMEGEAKEQAESFGSLKVGVLLILLAIYALLAIPFKSYSQPVAVMSIIPIGIVGALLGHMIMGKTLSIMSIMGIVALIGVVINDSLVLVDYINKQRAKGMAAMEAVLTAGTARFRPVILTSLTTFAGLTPLLLEKSTQAQFLIPMAISLGFGILFATLITLVIVPVNYMVGYQMSRLRPAGVWWVSILLIVIFFIDLGQFRSVLATASTLLSDAPFISGAIVIQLALLLIAILALFLRHPIAQPSFLALLVLSVVITLFYMKHELVEGTGTLLQLAQPLLFALIAYYTSELRRKEYFSKGVTTA